MATSILALLAAIVPIVVWLWRRKIEQNDLTDTPENKINEAIATRNEASVNDILDANLRNRMHNKEVRSDNNGGKSSSSETK